jgi:hypothetical protein
MSVVKLAIATGHAMQAFNDLHYSNRCRRTLDLILTNLAKFYLPPVKLPPFGLDHFTILSTPKHKVAGRTKYDISQVRNQHARNKAAISTFITEFDWSILDSLSSCDEKWSAFESIIRFGMDILLPTKTIKKRLDDPPWMTKHLKSLIQQRQKALAKGHDQLFKSLRITASIGNENSAGVNTMTQKSVNLKSLIPNSGGNLLTTCVEWIQSTTSMISDIFKACHPLVMKLMKPTKATHFFHTWRIP